MTRLASAARIQLTTWRSSLMLPWAILGSSFALNLIIFALVPSEGTHDTTGGLATIYFVVLIAYIVTVREFLPFTLGLGMTRRTFYATTSLLAIAESVVYGFLLYLLKLVENGTGGWGLQLPFFDLAFLPRNNPPLQLLGYIVPLLFMAFLGLFIGTVAKRWGKHGIFTLGALALVITGGLTVLASLTHQWVPIGYWFAAQPPALLFAGWPALLAAVLAAGSFLVIRRTTV